MRFESRQEAGRKLGDVLASYKQADIVVLALPRGGIVIGAEVAKKLKAPLGLILVKKLGHRYNPEYAIGAIAENGPAIYSPEETSKIRAEAAAREINQQRRKLYYGNDFEPPKLANKTVIVVDDGIATGLTMQAAIIAISNEGPKQIIVAVPVAPEDSLSKLTDIVDAVITLDNPSNFMGAVGSHYKIFKQVSDNEVVKLLRQARDDLEHNSAN